METTDSNIVDRLKKLPPYDDVVENNDENVIETPEESTTEQQDEPKEENIEQIQDETPTVEIENDRTAHQFAKLTENNKKLKQENDILKRKNVVESLRPEPTPFIPQYQPPTVNIEAPKPVEFNLVDSEGYVDTKQLQELGRITAEANIRAQRAEQLARESENRRMQDKRDFEESQMMREIHQQFPEIDPNGASFDETLYDAVRNELVGQYTRGENDIMKAVQKWHSILIKPMNKQEVQKKAEQKSQIMATSPNPSKTGVQKSDFEALRIGTLKGTKGSLAERLKRSGY